MNLFENLQKINENKDIKLFDVSFQKNGIYQAMYIKAYNEQDVEKYFEQNPGRTYIGCSEIPTDSELKPSKSIIDITTESTELSSKITEYWCYKEITARGYKVDITDSSVSIYFPDGDLYAHFTFKRDEDESDEYWYVYNHNDKKDSKGECINGALEYTDTYEDVVNGCLYYFWSRY